jgi:hypothetical protein
MRAFHDGDQVPISLSGMVVPGAEGNEPNTCAQREEQIRQDDRELFACLQAIPKPVKLLNRRKIPPLVSAGSTTQTFLLHRSGQVGVKQAIPERSLR